MLFRSLDVVARARPHVVAHNIETVERLTPTVRDRRATYRQSLRVLEYLKRAPEKLYTKSSIMVGLGETDEEILQVMRDLREHNVDMLTIGQYLQPSKHHLPVARFAHPDEFRMFGEEAGRMGFVNAASGPIVRSSYHADRQAQDAGAV